MKVDSNFVMSINGDAVTTEHTQPVYNPATRAVFAQVPDASREQLDQTVGFARAALKGWAATPAEGRQAALERYASLIEAHAEEFVSLLTREQGSLKQEQNGKCLVQLIGCGQWRPSGFPMR